MKEKFEAKQLINDIEKAKQLAEVKPTIISKVTMQDSVLKKKHTELIEKMRDRIKSCIKVKAEENEVKENLIKFRENILGEEVAVPD